MTRTNFYVLVDRITNTVLSHPSELPENWSNIYGLDSYTDEQLSNLEWAGHSQYAWIKFDIHFPVEYIFAEDWQVFAKETVKEKYAEMRWKKEKKGIVYKGIELETDDRTKTAILLKKQSITEGSTFSWKNNGKIFKLTTEDVINIANAIDDYVQQCFEIEAELITKLDLVEKPLDLAEFDLNIEWPSNVY